MASHAGLVFVLKTKKGYVLGDGEFSDSIDKALRIPFSKVGFTRSAFDVYKKLGFDSVMTENEIRLESVSSSYDSRLGTIERLYMELGNSYNEARELAALAFSSSNLIDYENYLNFINKLKLRVVDFYEKSGNKEIINIAGNDVTVYKKYEKVTSENKITNYYMSNGEEIEQLEFTLKNPHVENFFDL